MIKTSNKSSVLNLRKFFSEYYAVVAIVILIIVFSFTSQYFLKYDNLKNILIQTAPVSICAIGQAFCIIKGGMDLSLGQNLCVTSCTVAILLKAGMNPWLAIIIGLLLGVAIGSGVGFLHSIIGLPTFIASLAFQNICRGAAKIITQATPISGFPREIDYFGKEYIGPIPICVIIMVVFYMIFAFISRRTRFGRILYAIGGNKEAAFFAGIDVKKYTMFAHMLAGGLAAFAGLITMSRLSSVAITSGNLYEFDATTACAIGGIALSGGKGKLIYALLGILFLQVFFNGMVMLNVDSFWQEVLKGIVLAVSVSFDVLRGKKAAVKKKVNA